MSKNAEIRELRKALFDKRPRRIDPFSLIFGLYIHTDPFDDSDADNEDKEEGNEARKESQLD